eukprot:6455580-Amphidinium_carterae.3
MIGAGSTVASWASTTHMTSGAARLGSLRTTLASRQRILFKRKAETPVVDVPHTKDAVTPARAIGRTLAPARRRRVSLASLRNDVFSRLCSLSVRRWRPNVMVCPRCVFMLAVWMPRLVLMLCASPADVASTTVLSALWGSCLSCNCSNKPAPAIGDGRLQLR